VASFTQCCYSSEYPVLASGASSHSNAIVEFGAKSSECGTKEQRPFIKMLAGGNTSSASYRSKCLPFVCASRFLQHKAVIGTVGVILQLRAALNPCNDWNKRYISLSSVPIPHFRVVLCICTYSFYAIQVPIPDFLVVLGTCTCFSLNA